MGRTVTHWEACDTAGPRMLHGLDGPSQRLPGAGRLHQRAVPAGAAQQQPAPRPTALLQGAGSVCLDVINQTWSPMFDLVNVFETFLPQVGAVLRSSAWGLPVALHIAACGLPVTLHAAAWRPPGLAPQPTVLHTVDATAVAAANSLGRTASCALPTAAAAALPQPLL